MTETPNAAFLAPGPYVVIDDCLGADLANQFLTIALNSQEEFRPARISANVGDGPVPEVDAKRRIASIFDMAKEQRQIFRAAIERRVPEIAKALATPAFDPSRYEIEMAAHGDGAHFARHIDTLGVGVTASGDEQPKVRTISVVYYFFKQPKRFTGGTFRLHAIAGNGAPGTFADIEPAFDRALAFPAWMPHEVLPVSVPGGAFEDSRFAINCWLHR